MMPTDIKVWLIWALNEQVRSGNFGQREGFKKSHSKWTETGLLVSKICGFKFINAGSWAKHTYERLYRDYIAFNLMNNCDGGRFKVRADSDAWDKLVAKNQDCAQFKDKDFGYYDAMKSMYKGRFTAGERTRLIEKLTQELDKGQLGENVDPNTASQMMTKSNKGMNAAVAFPDKMSLSDGHHQWKMNGTSPYEKSVQDVDANLAGSSTALPTSFAEGRVLAINSAHHVIEGPEIKYLNVGHDWPGENADNAVAGSSKQSLRGQHSLPIQDRHRKDAYRLPNNQNNTVSSLESFNGKDPVEIQHYLNEVLLALEPSANRSDHTDKPISAIVAPVIIRAQKRKYSDNEDGAYHLFHQVFNNGVSPKDKMDACQTWLLKQQLEPTQLQMAICVVCENVENFYFMNDLFKKAFLMGRGVQFRD